jgi:hypothetical protein
MLLAAPLIAAADLNLGFGGADSTGGITQAVNQLFSLIAAFFNFNLSPQVLQGVLKFMFFIMLFAIFFWAGRRTVWKEDDGSGVNKRTAGIVAFAIAMISMLFMPNEMFLNMSSIFPAIVTVMVVLFPAIIAIGIAFFVLGGKSGESSGAMKHGLGAMLLAVAWGWTAFWHSKVLASSGMNSAGGAGSGVYFQLVGITMSWALVILPLLFIIKLFQALMNIRAGGGGGGGGSSGKPFSEKLSDTIKDWKNFNTRVDKPGSVSNIRFSLNPTKPGQVLVEWDPLPAEQNIDHYEMEYTLKERATRSWKTGGIATDGWAEVSRSISGAEKSFSTGMLPIGDKMRIRMRGVNKNNNKGDWGESGYGAASSPPRPSPTFRKELDAIRNALLAADHAVDTAIVAGQGISYNDTAGHTKPAFTLNPMNNIPIPNALPAKAPVPVTGQVLVFRTAILNAKSPMSTAESLQRALFARPELPKASTSERHELMSGVGMLSRLNIKMKYLLVAYKQTTHIPL